MVEREFECIQHQLTSLRRENRFLKFGLILCFVFASLPYLTGFQLDVIRAKKVVTERVEFVRDGKSVLSIILSPIENGLYILDEDGSRLVFLGRFLEGGMIGVHNKEDKIVAKLGVRLNNGNVLVTNKYGKPVAEMDASLDGGVVSVANKDGKSVASMHGSLEVGTVSVANKDGKIIILLTASPDGGSIGVANNEGKPVVVMSATQDDGVIVIRDKAGRTVWNAP